MLMETQMVLRVNILRGLAVDHKQWMVRMSRAIHSIARLIVSLTKLAWCTIPCMEVVVEDSKFYSPPDRWIKEALAHSVLCQIVALWTRTIQSISKLKIKLVWSEALVKYRDQKLELTRWVRSVRTHTTRQTKNNSSKITNSTFQTWLLDGAWHTNNEIHDSF